MSYKQAVSIGALLPNPAALAGLKREPKTGNKSGLLEEVEKIKVCEGTRTGLVSGRVRGTRFRVELRSSSETGGGHFG